jgi:hypothetical protein
MFHLRRLILDGQLNADSQHHDLPNPHFAYGGFWVLKKTYLLMHIDTRMTPLSGVPSLLLSSSVNASPDITAMNPHGSLYFLGF